MSEDDDSKEICDSLDMIDRLYGKGASSTVGHTSCPVATVLFQSSEAEAQHQTSASSFLPLKNISQYHDSPNESFIPLEKVGRKHRCLKRRGAAVRSQLFKNAFEASMSSYDSDGDGDDFSSVHASNSTICSRDGVEDIQTPPRKRIRHPVGGGEQEDEATNMSIQETSNMFGGLGLMAMDQSAAAVSPSANNSVLSFEDSGTIVLEHLEHGGSRRRIQRTLPFAPKTEQPQG